MTKRRNQWMAALLLIGALASLPLYGQSALEKKAQGLYAAKDYKACLELLEKEIQKPDASPIALRIAMNANMELGNPVTASQQASSLLKRVGTKNSEIVFETAQIAELNGDEKMAVARYLSYIQKQYKNPRVKSRLTKAISYAGQRGTYVDVLIARTRLEGKDAVAPSINWAMRHYLDRGDFQSVIELLAFVVSPEGFIDSTRVLNETLNAIYDKRNDFQPAAAKRAVEILCNAPLKASLNLNTTWRENTIYDLIRKANMSNMDRYFMAQNMIKAWGYVPESDPLFFDVINKQFDSCQSEEAKLAFGKEMMLLMPNFLAENSSTSVGAHRKFFWFIQSKTKVFPKVIPPEMLGKFLAAYAKRANASRTDMNNGHAEFNKIVAGGENAYYNTLTEKGKIQAFCIAFGKDAPAYVIDYMSREATAVAGKKGGIIDTYLGDPKDPGYALREARIAWALARTQRHRQFVNAARNVMLLTNYNPEEIANMIRTAKLPSDAAANMLNSVIMLQGASAKMDAILDSLYKKGYPQNSKISDLKLKKNAGANAAYAAAAKCFSLGGDKAAELHAAAIAFTKVSKASLPQRHELAATAEDELALNVFEYHRRYVWNNNAQAKELILAWAPKLTSGGKITNELLSRSIAVDKEPERPGGTYYKMINIVLPAIVSADDGWFDYANDFHWNPERSHPKATDVNPFKGNYGRFNGDFGLKYLFRAMRNGCFSPAFAAKQMEAMLESGDGWITPSFVMYDMGNDFGRKEFTAKDAMPASFYIALLKRMAKQADKYNYPEYAAEARILWFTPVDKKQDVMNTYISMIRKRPYLSQIRSINTAFADAIRHTFPIQMRLDFLEKTLVPILKENTAKNLQYVVPSGIILEQLNWIANPHVKESTPEQKAQAVEIMKLFAKAYAAGNIMPPRDHNGGSAAEIIEKYALTDILESGKLERINTAVTTMAIGHKYDTSTGRSRDIMNRTGAKLDKQGTEQIKYVYLSVPTEGDREHNSSLKGTFNRQIAKVARAIPGIVAVDKSDAAYDLFLAQQMKREGNALQAWGHVRGKLDVLTRRWKEFDFDFVVWSVEQCRKSGLFKEGLDLAQTLWMEENALAPVEAAQLALSKGDIYRDWKSYPAAKIEYEALSRNKRYEQTAAGRLAKFRLIELLILTQDFTTARTMLERLQMSTRLDDQAEAYYLQARIDYEQMDDEAALGNLDEVFKRIATHPEARLLEGHIRIRNNDLSNLTLQIGQSMLATIAIPGKTIKLEIYDRNLAIIRGGKSLPVLVTTSHGKDSEIVQLNPDPQNPNKFSYELITTLGKAVPSNMVLELTGDDIITYCVEPNFAKEHGHTDIPSNQLEIRYPARMYVSSKPILSEQEQDDAALARSYDLIGGRASERDISKIVRPGSPFYVRVIDYDQSIDPNAPDKINVDITCSSGDEMKGFELVETGPSTGVFEAIIKTDIPFPSISVSDAVEGVDYTAVINSTKTGSWKSLPDSKRPKWLEIDTMTSCNIKDATIEMPDPNAIKTMRVIASIDKSSDEIAVYPASTEKVKGGLSVLTKGVWNNNPALDNIRKQFVGDTTQGMILPKTSFSRDMVKGLRGRNQWVVGKISGAFYLSEPMELNLKFTQKEVRYQTAHLMIDDRVILSGTMNAAGLATKRTVTLTKGVHVLTAYFLDHEKNSAIEIGMLQPDGSYSPLPMEWFDTEKHPELVEFLQPKGVIEKTGNGFKLTMNETKPGQERRYRKLRWLIENYNGTQVEITKASITERGQEGKQDKIVVPVTQDLTSGKENKILEIAASDTITVKYQDKIRIDENKATLAENLSSSFCNGGVDFRFEKITVDEEGASSIQYVSAARVMQGDSVAVWVTDPDEDLSEELETVKVQVSTTSGENIEMELLERGNNPATRGHFVETLVISDKTDAKKRMLKVVPGDTITVRYLDKENNSPGIPYHRIAKVLCEGKTDLDLVVFDTKLMKIEDRSQAAEARKQMLKSRLGSRVGEIKLYKDQIEAKAYETTDPNEVLIVNSKVPLMFVLRDPSNAKHAQSTVTVEVLTDTEIKAAQEEQREQMPLTVEMPLVHISSLAGKKGYPTRIQGAYHRYNPLNTGCFAGLVRLQLGSANDEINDLVSSSETFNLLGGGNEVRLDSDAFKVPTVIVSGADKVYLTYKDSSGAELCKRTVQLRSDGDMELYDKTYQMPQTAVHLGQNYYVQVHDPDRDRTPERDVVDVIVGSKLTKDQITVQLSETLVHSGIFTGSIKVDIQRPAAPGEEVKRPTANTIWSNFGDEISFTYKDEIPLHETEARTVTLKGTVFIGADGELAAFTKKFKDPDMAVKTNFLMAEALFEMAKSHKALKGADGKPDKEKAVLAKAEIAKGKRVLEEALRDYPNTSLKAQGEFLLANLSQQLEDYQTAISQFSTVISRYPDSEYAPKSYYQKGVCFERMAAQEKDTNLKQQIGDMACEEYVRLTYLYPNSALATDAKLRLGNYYYRTKRHRLAASVLEKFGVAHQDHKYAAQALILAGYASVRFEEQKVKYAQMEKRTYKPDFTQAIRIFLEVDEKHKANPDFRAEAMYFAGDCLFKQGTHESQVKSYQVFQRLIWDYPESKWAKHARGRMAANPIKNVR